MYDNATHRAAAPHARQLTAKAQGEIRDEVSPSKSPVKALAWMLGDLKASFGVAAVQVLALLEGENDTISLPTLAHAHAALFEVPGLL